MTPFENTIQFANDLAQALAFQQALENLETLKEQVGEDSTDFKMAHEILIGAILLMSEGKTIEA